MASIAGREYLNMSFEETQASQDTSSSISSPISRAGNRLLDAARRNPEALVILAAGAAMLLRRTNIYGSETSAGSGRAG